MANKLLYFFIIYGSFSRMVIVRLQVALNEIWQKFYIHVAIMWAKCNALHYHFYKFIDITWCNREIIEM